MSSFETWQNSSSMSQQAARKKRFLRQSLRRRRSISVLCRVRIGDAFVHQWKDRVGCHTTSCDEDPLL